MTCVCIVDAAIEYSAYLYIWYVDLACVLGPFRDGRLDVLGYLYFGT
jgi:hypothetical protein